MTSCRRTSRAENGAVALGVPEPVSRRAILPDQLRPGLRLVFCGSAAGTVSAMRGAYYAGPGNRFWPTLHAVGLTPRRFAPDEFTLLLDLGIGLTDMAKYAFGRDTVLRPEDDDRDGLAARIRACRPALLAFNGKRAAAAFLGVPSRELAYGDGPELPDFPPIFVLPSTSGAATGHWDLSWWHVLAARVPPRDVKRSRQRPLSLRGASATKQSRT